MSSIPPPAPRPAPEPLEPGVLWQGEQNTLTSAATGGKVVKARYKITADHIVFEAGLLSSKEEFVPMWAVRDLDLKQSMTQKARGIGDVRVRLEHNDYTGGAEVTLSGIADPKPVRDMLMQLSDDARKRRHAEQNTQTVNYTGGMQPPPPAAAPAPVPAPAPAPANEGISVADELKKLAELKELGVLSEEEFAEQKARLLAG